MQQHVETDGENQKAIAETLFHRHAPAIFAFLRQQCSSREDAEDILLEVFTAALEQKRLSNLSPDRQQALLWRITRNKQIDAYRRSARRSPILPIESAFDDLFAETEQAPEHEIIRMEEYARLHSMVQTLQPLQQKILRLRFVNELRSPQIATLVGKSEVAVRAIISRALNQLRALYREGER